jgi:formate hydrogenlyase transcriptional activator
VIERAVVETRTGVLAMPGLEPRSVAAPSAVRTLAQVEREHILATLAETNWILGGWNGAAARLGLSRTTLISKMQRLGISRAAA